MQKPTSSSFDPFVKESQHTAQFDPFAPPKSSGSYKEPEVETDDIFGISSAKPTPEQSPNVMPHVQPVQHDPFGDDPFGNDPEPVKTNMPVQQNNDLEFFFDPPTVQNNVPKMAPQQVAGNDILDFGLLTGQGNGNKVGVAKDYGMYNDLNTSNMKDMSALGINNFLEINKQNVNEHGQPIPQSEQKELNKFSLREELSGTQFDQPSNSNVRKTE